MRCTPGGGTQVQRGVAPALRISRKKGSFFKTSACPRFCKRRVLFCTPGTKYGGQNPLTIHKIYAALTPSDCRSDWASEFASAKQAEDYKIESQTMCSRSSNVSVLLKERVFIYWEKSAYY